MKGEIIICHLVFDIKTISDLIYKIISRHYISSPYHSSTKDDTKDKPDLWLFFKMPRSSLSPTLTTTQVSRNPVKTPTQVYQSPSFTPTPAQVVPNPTQISSQALATTSVTPNQVAVQFTQQASVSDSSPLDPSQNQGITMTQGSATMTQGSTQTQEYLNFPTQSQEYLKGATLNAPPQKETIATNDTDGNTFNVEKEKRKRFLRHLRAKARKSSSSISSKAKYCPSDTQLLSQNGRYMDSRGIVVEVDTTKLESKLLNNSPGPFFGSNGTDEDFEKERFELFIDREEIKAMAEEGEKLPPAKKRATCKESSNPEKIYSGCGKPLPQCDNVLYGEYCREAVISYHYMNPVGTTDDLTGKRIFINKYNNASEWESFKRTKSV